MIKIAYAETDITPTENIELCGFALRSGPATTVNDPLKCRWLVIQADNSKKVIIGSADIISLSRGRYKNVRRSINEKLNCKLSGIALATTHTHSGPATVPLRYAGKMNDKYMAGLETAISGSASAALATIPSQVSIRIGKGTSDWAVNRRNPESGPVDNEIITLSFTDTKTGRLHATIVNYACHPVVLGFNSNMVSADYPGALTKYIEDKTGAPCLFINGACGDINPKNAHQHTGAEVQKAGKSIGANAMKAIAAAKFIDSKDIDYRSTVVSIPVHQPKSRLELERRLEMLHERFGIDPALFSDRVARDVRYLKEGRFPKQVRITLSLLSLGSDAAILFVPGELFSSIGSRIKALYAPQTIMIAGFSNGSVGYLSDKQAYKDGGYEPYFANFFYGLPEFEPNLEDALLAGATRLKNFAKKGD